MGYINGGGVVLEVGGNDKGDGKRVCVCVCVCLCAVRAMGRYERVQGNEVLTGGRWGGRWGRWSSGRGTDAAPAAAVPPGRWAESSSSASWCLLVSLVLEASAKFQVSGLCSCELVASVAARDGVVGEMRACVTMGGARCEALEARVLMQLPMLAGLMTATAIDDGMRLMVAQERAIGKPSSGAECGKQVFFSCGTGARHPNARAIWRRVGRTTWSQPGHSLALLVCLPSSDRREAAGSGHLRTTGDGRHPERPARIVQCSSTSTSAPSDRASSGPCLCLQRSQKGRCQSQQDERIGPGEQATRKKRYLRVGCSGLGSLYLEDQVEESSFEEYSK